MSMLRSLLTARFQLTFHREPKVFSIYELEVAKSGSKNSKKPAAPDNPPTVGPGVVYPQRIRAAGSQPPTMRDFTLLSVASGRFWTGR